MKFKKIKSLPHPDDVDKKTLFIICGINEDESDEIYKITKEELIFFSKGVYFLKKTKTANLYKEVTHYCLIDYTKE